MRTTHGHAYRGRVSSEYSTWKTMIARCHRPGAAAYHAYGAVGITVCDRWRGEGGFERFLADMGPKPSRFHSLDRFPDQDGNYEPGNVRWATPEEQQSNTSANVYLEVDGVRMTIAGWARATGLKYGTIHSRLVMGWTPEQAVKTPRVEKPWLLAAARRRACDSPT